MLTTPPPSRRARLAGPALLLLSAVIVACTGTPSPSPTPGSSPSPGGSPPATGSADPSPTASPTPTIPEGDISHPTGSTDVILRMEEGGGFVPIEWLLTQAPVFTLYGDGTFIVKPLEDPDLPGGFGSAQPRFLQGHLDEESVQALLAFALANGRLAVARERYTDDRIADASTTIFTINAGGFDKRVEVYALAEVFEPQMPDAVDRTAFHELAELLRSFESRARAGELGPIVLYQPTHYRLTLLEGFGLPAGGPTDWPWDHISPDDFRPAGELTIPQLVVPADEAAAIVELPSGGHPGIAVTRDGEDWQLGVRPLLPDEAPED